MAEFAETPQYLFVDNVVRLRNQLVAAGGTVRSYRVVVFDPEDVRLIASTYFPHPTPVQGEKTVADRVLEIVGVVEVVIRPAPATGSCAVLLESVTDPAPPQPPGETFLGTYVVPGAAFRVYGPEGSLTCLADVVPMAQHAVLLAPKFRLEGVAQS